MDKIKSAYRRLFQICRQTRSKRNGCNKCLIKEDCDWKEKAIVTENDIMHSYFGRYFEDGLPEFPIQEPESDVEPKGSEELGKEKTYPELLREDAKQFVKTVSFVDFSAKIAERVMGQEQLELLLAAVYNYIEGIAKTGIPPKLNTLLTAPSGSGKTETYRALRDYFKEFLPRLVISYVDTTQVTTEGFKGKDTADVITDLIVGETGGYGILFLDELDKRLAPQYSAEGMNVGHEVQGQLLSLVEGKAEWYPTKKKGCVYIDTELTMFIGCGSFNVIREEKKRKSEEKHIGFTSQAETVGYFDDITREDLLEFGCSHEFVGRFSLIINYHVLDSGTVEGIIENARLHIAYKLNTPLELSADFKEHLTAIASGEFGCRMIYSTILEMAMKAYSQVLKTRTSDGVSPIIRLDIGNFELINPTGDGFFETLQTEEREYKSEDRSRNEHLNLRCLHK